MRLLYRILSGQIIVDISNRKYIINPTSYIDKYESEIIHDDIIESLKNDPDYFSKEDDSFKFMLIREGLKHTYKDDLKKIAKDIEDEKVKLFEIVTEKGNEKDTVEKIKKLNGDLMEMLEKLHNKDSITIEGMAELEKTKFLLRRGLNKKVSEPVLDRIITWLTKNFIKEEDYRKIARSSIFSNIVQSGRPFKNHPLTDEQLSLMHWYRFYKNVYRHQERPLEHIIENDWALDGWCIKQSKKNKTSDAQTFIDGKATSDAVRNSVELFIPRKPGTDISQIIDDANTPEAKAYKKAKFALINRGKLNESADVKLTESF